MADAGAYPYRDLRDYLHTLDSEGLLHSIDEPVDKDAELVPLVRLQFRGLPESRRRAFHFTRVKDARGRTYEGSVLIGGFAASREVYATALGAAPAEVAARWAAALDHPVEPELLATGPCKENVLTGQDLLDAAGVEAFPHPVSTPGFDPAPFLTAPYWITRDPEDGTYNVGTYRGMIKGPDRIGLQMDTPTQHIAIHLAKARRAGRKLQVAVVLGAVPAVGFASVQKIPYGVSEYAVAGGLMGRPLDVVACETVDLVVPAHAEIVIEGEIDPEHLESEGPFGEASGYMGPRTMSPVLEVTAITHRTKPVVQAFISEFPPSESTLMRKIAFENVYLRFLKQGCNIGAVRRVVTYESGTCNMFFVIQLSNPTAGQARQALYAASGYEASMGKTIIAVDDDIDPEDMDAVIWAMSFRMQPARDVTVLPGKLPRLDPSAATDGSEASSSALLIDATRKMPYPPTSLPARPYMERARALWDDLGLPELQLTEPWHGYELGDWSEEDRRNADAAARGGRRE
ncbi:carboxylase [Streptomyces sulfonofaciens]|uniref:Carboxylase n=1 Tax=Streptomyces sulfonofaciens TaxID=68272 RepID=A0A919GE78_9ACTN|nr:UbiD family decarboxylase [Streptomyces sulfonofaciens]GHH82910.1 carboxylase [Streptomyces sulfonofaciens]